jgi:hypothetical protein
MAHQASVSPIGDAKRSNDLEDAIDSPVPGQSNNGDAAEDYDLETVERVYR